MKVSAFIEVDQILSLYLINKDLNQHQKIFQKGFYYTMLQMKRSTF